MRQLNQGLIFTNENCIGCNRCISGCPVLGANVSVVINKENRILVDGSKCIHCGHCIDTCKHNARDYRDDTNDFLLDLAKGYRISMIIAPSFFIEYKETAGEILQHLKEMGVGHFYHGGFGADIHTYEAINYLSIAEQEGCLSSACPAIVHYAEKYAPELLDRFLPVLSPMECTAVYVRKYLKDECPIAFLSPCIAKKDELEDPSLQGIVSYNVTFAKLMEQMDSMHFEEAEEPLQPELTAEGDPGLTECLAVHDEGFWEAKEKAVVELADCGLGKLYPVDGGLSENIRHYMNSDTIIRKIEGVDTVYPYLKTYEERLSKNQRTPLMVDALNCQQGCITGTGLADRRYYDDEALFTLQDIRSQSGVTKQDAETNFAALTERFKELRSSDFVRNFRRNLKVDEVVSDAEMDEIYRSMYKFTPEDRCVDCHSCGYDSCRDMVRAIATNVNHKENCVHYMRDENLRLYLTDPMTGIPNSNAFNRHLNKILEEHNGLGYSAIFFNVRNFKLVNKKYGSKTGDKILIEYSKKVASLAGEGELIARWGGDNYIGLFKTVRLQYILHQLEDIMILINRGESLEECHLSIRAAIYTLTGKETIAGQIMGRITTTYATMNKDGRTNILYFNEELGKKILHDTRIEEMLEPALLNKEFVVYYQPKVNMKTHQLIGAEALVRWNRAGKLIPPMEFIPICESNGFVKRIDYYVLNQVCSDIHRWIEQGIQPVRVSFNFSKQHLDDPQLADHIHDVAEKYQVPRGILEVEFTEMAYVDDYERLVTTIAKLNDYGIMTSIDDFGTGYSSLNLLQNVKFNTLKLDKSFVQTPSTDKRNRAVITNIIRMAKELEMEIIAEGVETEEELSFLSGLSCDVAQGYLFDKPLSPEAFCERLQQKQYTLSDMQQLKRAQDTGLKPTEPVISEAETLPPQVETPVMEEQTTLDMFEDVMRRRGEDPKEEPIPRRALWMEEEFRKK